MNKPNLKTLLIVALLAASLCATPVAAASESKSVSVDSCYVCPMTKGVRVAVSNFSGLPTKALLTLTVALEGGETASQSVPVVLQGSSSTQMTVDFGMPVDQILGSMIDTADPV